VRINLIAVVKRFEIFGLKVLEKGRSLQISSLRNLCTGCPCVLLPGSSWESNISGLLYREMYRKLIEINF